MNNKISFKELVHELAGRGGISQSLSRRFVQELAQVVQEGLLEDGVVRLSGLGTFKIKVVTERRGRHPRTGAPITIPSRKKVLFKPEKALRELIQIALDTPEKSIRPHTSAPAAKDITPPTTEANPFDAFLNASFIDGALEVEQTEPPYPAPVQPQSQTSVPEPPGAETSASAKPVTRPRRHVREEQKNRKALYWSIVALLIIVLFYGRTLLNEEDQPEIARTVHPEKPVAEQVVSKAPPRVQKEQSKPTRKSARRNLRSHLTRHGESLWRLAVRYYDNGYLWPLIYEANHQKIKNPDFLVKGSTLVIPELEGSVSHPTQSDKETLAAAHIRAYRAYRTKHHEEALNHLKVATRFSVAWIKAHLTEIDPVDRDQLFAESSKFID